MERNNVVLVDKDDNAIDEMGKLVAHEQGQLHRSTFNKDEVIDK